MMKFLFIFLLSSILSQANAAANSVQSVRTTDESLIITERSGISRSFGAVDFVAQIRYAPTSLCSWSRTGTSLGSFNTDADCPSPTVEVSSSQYTVDTTDDDLPTAKIINAKPGIYVVTATFNTDYGAPSIQASFGISDGTDIRGIIGENVGDTLADYGRPTKTVVAAFSYESTGTRTFEMVGASSSSSVFIEGVPTNRSLTFTIFRYAN